MKWISSSWFTMQKQLQPSNNKLIHYAHMRPPINGHGTTSSNYQYIKIVSPELTCGLMQNTCSNQRWKLAGFTYSADSMFLTMSDANTAKRKLSISCCWIVWLGTWWNQTQMSIKDRKFHLDKGKETHPSLLHITELQRNAPTLFLKSIKLCSGWWISPKREAKHIIINYYKRMRFQDQLRKDIDSGLL